MQRRPVKQTAQTDNKKRTIIAVVVLALLLAVTGGAWAMWNREDPQVVAVRQMMADIENVPEAQRREHFGKMREAMDSLSEEQRDIVRDEMRQGWEQREMERYEKFFSMSAQEQIAELDRQIDRMERWRQEREKNRGKDDGDRRGRRGGDRGNRGPRAQSFGVGSNGSVGISDRDRSRLGRGSPEGRAYRDQFRRMMGERMRQRGIQGPTWGGRRG